MGTSGAEPRDTLYYDGACGMCRRSVRILRSLDWFGRLAFVDSTTVHEAGLPVARERALEGIPMRTAGGAVLVGFSAVRRALRQTPLGLLPALVMYLPGVSHAGERVYRAVARRRARSLTCAAPIGIGPGRG